MTKKPDSRPARQRGEGQRYVLPTSVTLKGICCLLELLTVGDITPAKFQTISSSVNEKLKDSRRRDRTTSADD
jgi:hypothetical protein